MLWCFVRYFRTNCSRMAKWRGDPLIAGFGLCDKGDTDVGVRRFRLAYTN